VGRRKKGENDEPLGARGGTEIMVNKTGKAKNILVKEKIGCRAIRWLKTGGRVTQERRGVRDTHLFMECLGRKRLYTKGCMREERYGALGNKNQCAGEKVRVRTQNQKEK